MLNLLEGLSGLVAYLGVAFARKKIGSGVVGTHQESTTDVQPTKNRPPRICITGISPLIDEKNQDDLDHILTEKRHIVNVLEQIGFAVEYILHKSVQSDVNHLLNPNFSLLVSVGPLLAPRLAGAISLDMQLSTAYNAHEMNFIYTSALSLISQAGFKFDLCFLLHDEDELRAQIALAEKTTDTRYLGLEFGLTYEYIINVRHMLLSCAVCGIIISFVPSSPEHGMSQIQFIYAIGICAWCIISTKFWKQKCTQLAAITNPNSLISHFSKSAPSIHFDISDKKSVIQHSVAVVGIIFIAILYILIQVIFENSNILLKLFAL